MTYPEFFDDIEKIVLKDNLANFLGATTDGEIEFSYIDVVKTAGHSCPTVLGAYLMTKEGLKALFGEDLAQRGQIKVQFAQKPQDGVAGVISNVITNITGATFDTGFKGLMGNHNRNNLMFFGEQISSNVRFTRLDTGKSVDVFYNPNLVPAYPAMEKLMNACINREASPHEQKEFAKFWQLRVQKISQSVDEVIKIEHL